MAKATIAQQEELINSVNKKINYDTKEFTLELLHSKFNRTIEDGITKEISIPFYQRNFVWDKKTQSRFIESILMGLPIPVMVFAEVEEGILEVIDGSQRIRTINDFLNNKLTLTGLEKLRGLNGLTFGEFKNSRGRKIKNETLRAIVLFNYDNDLLDISHELFDRLNTGGMHLTNMEIIKGTKTGEFINFIFDTCAKNSILKELSNFVESDIARGYREEFLIKYFALSDTMDLENSLSDYLDKYIDQKNIEFKEEDTLMDKYLEQFKNMLSFVKSNDLIKDISINKKNRLLAIYIGTTLALKQKPDLIGTEMNKNIFISDFITNSKYSSFSKLKENIELVKNILLG